MIKILGKIPREITVAVSGGVDSMVLLDFLSHNHMVTAAFYHHGTINSERAHDFLIRECNIRHIKLEIGHLTGDRTPGLSPEEFWRIKRYEFLDQFDMVVTAHTLDDAVETWVWSSLNGCPKLIPYRRNKIIRPLLLTEKKKLLDWAARKNVKWVEDSSNIDLVYTRNFIRHELMPGVRHVNPGIHTMIRKKLQAANIDE